MSITPEQRASRTAATARYRARNPEKVAAMQRSWRERNPTYHSEHAVGYKTRKLALARKRKYGDEKRPCPEHCEICGKRFNAEVSADRACFDHDHGTIAHRGW